jgi:non-homologous end joining protein Ku
MAISAWKGSVSLALLAMPIRLYTAARSEGIYLHQLHKACNSGLNSLCFASMQAPG